MKIYIILLASILSLVAYGQTKLPSPQTPQGFIARLLINEVPFPGEMGYVNEDNSKLAMRQILAVIVNRTYNIPNNYTQRQIAATSSDNIIKIITAGGERGQIDGFYIDAQGQLATVPRVEKRIQYLLSISNKGKPGRFANLINYANQIVAEFLKANNAKDIFKLLTKIGNTHVTGYGYSWMTDTGTYHPGGTFVKIPNNLRGSIGHNRFFTLKKL